MKDYKHCIHGVILYGSKCIQCNRSEKMKQHLETMNEALDILNTAFEGCKAFCDYEKCLIRYFAHNHIDEHTITFSSLNGMQIDTK